MELSFFDLNCWLLPLGISHKNNIRKKQILEEIKKRNPDIITLQEVWLIKDVNYFKKNLRGYYAVSSNSHFFNKSGLLTLTKLKPASISINFFQKTKKYSILEKLASKGVHDIKLNFNQKNLNIINTHLYYPTKEAEKLILSSELNFLINLTKSNTLILGDLNLNSKTLINKGQHTFFNSGNKRATYSSQNIYAKFVEPKKRSFRKILDYSLVAKNSILKVSSRPLVFPLLSDHYALQGTVRI